MAQTTISSKKRVWEKHRCFIRQIRLSTWIRIFKHGKEEPAMTANNNVVISSLFSVICSKKIRRISLITKVKESITRHGIRK
jgi:hypothetical protein